MSLDERSLKMDALRELLSRLSSPELTLEESRKVRAQMDLLVESRLADPSPAAGPGTACVLAIDPACPDRGQPVLPPAGQLRSA